MNERGPWLDAKKLTFFLSTRRDVLMSILSTNIVADFG